MARQADWPGRAKSASLAKDSGLDWIAEAALSPLPAVAAPPHPPELRPYRVAVYVVFVAFTLTFIFQVARSIFTDLYPGRASSASLARVTVTDCANSLGKLSRQLDAWSGSSVEPRGGHDWSGFTRTFEEQFGRFQTRCIDHAPLGTNQELADALSNAADKLDAVRAHLSRCGDTGREDRAALDHAMKALQVDVRAAGH